MERTVFSLPAGLHHRAKALADRQGQSVAALIRDTLEEARQNRRPLSIGEGRVGYAAVEERPQEGDEMKRLVISLPEGLLHRVRAQGQISGVSMAAYIRGALEERTRRERPKPQFGAFASGYTDTARLAGEMPYEPRNWR